MSFNPLDYSLCLKEPDFLSDVTSWHEHIPFAFTLMQMLQPRLFVELGTHKGDSYLAFCQAVDALGLSTVCCAVDSWEGDPQAGFYGEEIYQKLKEYHDSRYGGFSSLRKCYFDDALPHFEDKSIDLLHIDGLHTYEAVKHDFETWLPKVSDRGVVLFHDTTVTTGDFGVWRFFEEVSSKYPAFEFKHCNGLGVIAVGNIATPPLEQFFSETEQARLKISDFYNIIGNKISLNQEVTRLDVLIASLKQETVDKGRQLLEQEEKLREALAQADRKLSELAEKDHQLLEYENALNAIFASYSWKLTHPLRLLGELASLAPKSLYFFAKLPSHLTVENFRLLVEHFKNKGFVHTITAAYNAVTTQPIPHIQEVIPVLKPTFFAPHDDITLDHDISISVIIPTKNAGSDFLQLLRMIKCQQGIEKIEIVVVDSGSDDSTVSFAKEYGAKVIEIPPTDFTHSYARNLGAENASSNYLFFTVQDALIPSSTFFKEIYEIFKANNVSAISCAEYPREDADLFYRACCWNHYEFLEVNSGDRIFGRPAEENFITLRKNGQLSDIANFIPTDLFMRYKYHDDYAEDLDLGMRLIKDDLRIAFLSSIKIIHSHNRPAYYYLKRGHVDQIFLTRKFPDYPVAATSTNLIPHEILCTYVALCDLMAKIEQITLPCTTQAAFKIIYECLRSVKVGPITSQPQASKYVDDKFIEFISKLHTISVRTKPSNFSECNLAQSMTAFVPILEKFISGSYKVLDVSLIEELKPAIFKAFALLTGVALGNSYIIDKEGTNFLFENLGVNLREGV